MAQTGKTGGLEQRAANVRENAVKEGMAMLLGYPIGARLGCGGGSLLVHMRDSLLLATKKCIFKRPRDAVSGLLVSERSVSIQLSADECGGHVLEYFVERANAIDDSADRRPETVTNRARLPVSSV